MEERSRRATTLLAIADAKRAPPSRSRVTHNVQHDAAHDTPEALYPPAGFIPDTMLATLPPVGEGIIPPLSGNKEQERSVSFKNSLADLSDSDSIESHKIPAAPHYETEPPKCTRAFQSPFKLSASCTSARGARYKKDRTTNSTNKKKKEDELFIPNAPETDNKFKVAFSVAALLVFFYDKYFKVKIKQGRSVEGVRQVPPSTFVGHVKNILLKQPAGKLSIALHTILAHQEFRPSALGGVPPFRQNTFLTGTLMDKFHQENWACRSELPPTTEDIKSSVTWYHVLLLRPEVGNKPMIPADSLRHAPAVAMLNHLIWFLESAVDEDQDEQCNYSPGVSFFIQGIIALREQIMIGGEARWQQTT
jgi:hypothetical protein